jgi:hypothetical protein
VQSPPPGLPPQWGSSPPGPHEGVEPGYGDQPGPAGYGPPASGGHHHPTASDHGPQQAYPDYDATAPVGPDYPQAGYPQRPTQAPPAWRGHDAPVAGPTLQQAVSWITFAVIGLLGSLGAVLTLTLWINMSSAVNRANETCDRIGEEFSNLCRQQMLHTVPSIPTTLVICLLLMIAAGLAAAGGAVMLFLNKQMGQFLILGGGIVMVVLAIGCEARYGPTGRITYDLVVGFLIAAAGGLMLIPAYRMLLGLPPKLTGGPGPGRPHDSGQWPYGQPQAPQNVPPGHNGYSPQQW